MSDSYALLLEWIFLLLPLLVATTIAMVVLKSLTPAKWAGMVTVFWMCCYFSLNPTLLILTLVLLSYILYKRCSETELCSYGLMLAVMFPRQYTWDIPFPFAKIDHLLAMDTARLLYLSIFTPLMLRIASSQRRLPLNSIDKMVLAVFLIFSFYQFRSPSTTDAIRRIFISGIEFFPLYFCVSRLAINAESTAKIFTPIIFASTVLAIIAFFESYLFQHSFENVPTFSFISSERHFDGYSAGFVRNETLRAYGPFLQPLAFGCFLGFTSILSITCGLGSKTQRNYLLFVAPALLISGMFFSITRTPIAFIAFYFVSIWILNNFQPWTLRRLLTQSLVPAILMAVVLIPTSLFNSLAAMLPNLGNEFNQSTAYRALLMRASVKYLQSAPLLGVLNFFERPPIIVGHGSRQIDVTNTYLQVSFKYGLVGLAIVFGVLITIGSVYTKKIYNKGTKEFTYRTTVFSLFAAVLIMAFNISMIPPIPFIFVVVLGLVSAAVQASSYEGEHI